MWVILFLLVPVPLPNKDFTNHAMIKPLHHIHNAFIPTYLAQPSASPPTPTNPK